MLAAAEVRAGGGFGEYREHRSKLAGEDRLARGTHANFCSLAEMAVLDIVVGYEDGGMPPLVTFGSPERAVAEFGWVSPLALKPRQDKRTW